MLRGKDLIGLPVLEGTRLQRIGRVEEVLLSQDGTHLCGLVLENGGLFSQRRVLDYGAVYMVGPTHVVAQERYLDEEAGTHCGRALQGLPVLGRSGEELGMMDDLHYEPSTGRIVAFELSRGFVDDLLGGKEIVALRGPVLAGEAAILLDAAGDDEGGELG